MIVHDRYNFDDLKRFFVLDHSTESQWNYTLFVEVPKINQIQAIAMMSSPIPPAYGTIFCLPKDIEDAVSKGKFERMGGFRTTLKAVLSKYVHARLNEISPEQAKFLYPEITQIEIVEPSLTLGEAELNGQCEQNAFMSLWMRLHC